MPSSKRVRASILEEIRRLPPDKRIIDLGSGWGGLAFAAARAFPDRQVEGYEMAAVPLLFSKLRLLLPTRPENLRFHYRDIRLLRPEDGVVYLAYLAPAAMESLRRRFEETLPREAILVSALFAVRGWRPTAAKTARDLHKTSIFVYELNRLPGSGRM